MAAAISLEHLRIQAVFRQYLGNLLVTHTPHIFVASHRYIASSGAVALMFLIGCSSQPPGVPGVEIDAESVSATIIDSYDANKNGSLSQDELASAPPISSKHSWYDADHNGQISADELRKGLEAIFDPRVGLVTFACEVTRNGQPLSGADVKFVPLPALEGAIPPASGVTDRQGVVMPGLTPEDLPDHSPTRVPFMRPGLYLVQVTHEQLDVPEQYNVKTILGKEVSGFTTAGGPMKIQLKF
jgi:hypothetical protein